MRQYNKTNFEILQEYQRKYYLRNREQISNIRAEYYIDKIRERNKNKNNVVIVSNKIVISIIDGTNAVVFLRKYWRSISLSAFVISGILTPTIDGYTQLSFAFSALTLYLLVINVIKKRITIKINVLCSLS
jgi:hypothetical protein